MIPRRRYRIFVIAAVIILFLLYRVSQNEEWDPSAYTRLSKPQPNPNPKLGHGRKPVQHDDPDAIRPPQQTAPPTKTKPQPPPVDESPAEDGGRAPVKIPNLKTDETGSFALPTDGPRPDAAHDAADADITAPIHWQDPPGGMKERPPTATTTRIHWIKVPDKFPVDEAGMILLPTHKPLVIPRIQHKFGPEAAADREKRVKRQQMVRDEMVHAWSGYRKHAWMHDELRPVTNASHDPFCGWAASLVDALDTLWIMNLKEEFDEAARAVANIDFTYSFRKDIPVFETIIRYLGGLVAAYDLSGGKQGKYEILLDKAHELAEILMGVFDTPNRMPILYYNWEPEHTSQPHRASTVSVAELSTMQLEFTRLAQLTGKQKYYDAIARITNEMEDLQLRGTSLDGIFPERLDASGCNQTAKALEEEARSEEARKQNEERLAAVAAAKKLEEPEGYRGVMPPTTTSALGADATPAGGLRRRQVRVDEPSPPAAPPAPGQTPDPKPKVEPGPVDNVNSFYDESSFQNGPWGPYGDSFDYRCPKQGLTPALYGTETYSMGGSQDSAYEYFPKQYLLLGGNERKYQHMHLKTVAAVKKWLLYRPMVPGERDILFTAKATTAGKPDKDLQLDYEVTHLTCFVGGMFALGGMIFDIPEDVEIAKKLADGCVWAYEATASGIMPETAMVVPCQSMTSCPWNETVWHQHLDPAYKWRDRSALEWDQKQADLKKQQEEDRKAEELRKKEQARKKEEYEKQQLELPTTKTPAKEADALKDSAEGAAGKESSTKGTGEERHKQNAALFGENPEPPKAEEKAKAYPRPEPGANTAASPMDAPGKTPLKKREVDPRNHAQDITGPPPAIDMNRAPVPAEGGERPKIQPYRHRSDTEIEDMLNINAPQRGPGGFTSEERARADAAGTAPRPASGMRMVGGVSTQVTLEAVDERPMTHKEFVENEILTKKIPKGFVNIPDKRYILRPEAIESVWYMYRITGDPVWMEKGWRMWEAVIKATRTRTGHSAIDNVLLERPDQVDSMESFWFAETLKYFYLLFAGPDVISLDDWVLNTEAHPFRRPVPTK